MRRGGPPVAHCIVAPRRSGPERRGVLFSPIHTGVTAEFRQSATISSRSRSQAADNHSCPGTKAGAIAPAEPQPAGRSPKDSNAGERG